MSEGFSLIKIDGKVVKPATLLIQKIADAIGGGFKPRQIRRVAEAEADAEVIKAKAQIEITKLQQRALTRFIIEESKKQDNIESITEKAIFQLNASSTPQDIENDWITNFFDKCRIISDEEMQSLWAKVLAGEANSPGTYSKRTINSLGSIDKNDAQLFTALCGFLWFVEEILPLIFDVHATIYRDQGINFTALIHLDDIGLISFEPLTGFKRTELPNCITTKYYENPLTLEFKKPENNELNIGTVLLTQTGKQLSAICSSKPIHGFYNYTIEQWTKEGLTLSSPSHDNK